MNAARCAALVDFGDKHVVIAAKGAAPALAMVGSTVPLIASMGAALALAASTVPLIVAMGAAPALAASTVPLVAAMGAARVLRPPLQWYLILLWTAVAVEVS